MQPPPSNFRLFESYGVAGAGVVPIELAAAGEAIAPLSPVAAVPDSVEVVEAL